MSGSTELRFIVLLPSSVCDGKYVLYTKDHAEQELGERWFDGRPLLAKHLRGKATRLRRSNAGTCPPLSFGDISVGGCAADRLMVITLDHDSGAWKAEAYGTFAGAVLRNLGYAGEDIGAFVRGPVLLAMLPPMQDDKPLQPLPARVYAVVRACARKPMAEGE